MEFIVVSSQLKNILYRNKFGQYSCLKNVPLTGQSTLHFKRAMTNPMSLILPEPELLKTTVYLTIHI